MKGHKWFAAVYDPMFSKHAEDTFMKELRPRLLSGARGRVLEIGAGTGASFPYYRGHTFEELVITEPDPYMLERLQRKFAYSGVTATVLQAPAEKLPFPDDSFDTVVSFHVLCSVADLRAAFAEIQRVLKPDGRFLFVDHVRSHNPAGALVQHAIQPLWSWLGAGCHPNRDIATAVENAGFRFKNIERFRPFGVVESMFIGAITRPHILGEAVAVHTRVAVSP